LLLDPIVKAGEAHKDVRVAGSAGAHHEVGQADQLVPVDGTTASVAVAGALLELVGQAEAVLVVIAVGVQAGRLLGHLKREYQILAAIRGKV